MRNLFKKESKQNMDELIRRYAEILKSAKVGDFTYEGILAEFAQAVLILNRNNTPTLNNSTVHGNVTQVSNVKGNLTIN
jgi:hypothetical protein